MARTYKTWWLNMDTKQLQPYNYQAIAPNDFTFTTKHGVNYRAYFLPYGEYTPQYGSIYIFNLSNINEETHPVDIRISHTVAAILSDFFEEEENSAVIMCDNSDSKEFKRFKLFDRWYKKLKDKDVMKLDSAIETDYYSLYISLFVHNNNPWKNNVIKEYYRMISEEFTITED